MIKLFFLTKNYLKVVSENSLALAHEMSHVFGQDGQREFSDV